MYKIIETHCHLDYLKEKPLVETLQEAKESGVEKIITISVEPDNFDAAMELAEQNEEVYFTQGTHPHDAKFSTDESLRMTKERSSHPKFVAVGEIGLDYHYNHSPQETQIKVFKEQLEIAIETKLPVVIHSREADEDMMAILSEYAPRLEKKGVIHSFSSGEELAKKALELGFYLGFNGILTFKKAQNVRDIVEICPLDKLLLETDAPFLTPVPYRGKENSPAKLKYILEKIAEIKQVSPKEIEETCYQNSLDLFFKLKS